MTSAYGIIQLSFYWLPASTGITNLICPKIKCYLYLVRLKNLIDIFTKNIQLHDDLNTFNFLIGSLLIKRYRPDARRRHTDLIIARMGRMYVAGGMFWCPKTGLLLIYEHKIYRRSLLKTTLQVIWMPSVKMRRNLGNCCWISNSFPFPQGNSFDYLPIRHELTVYEFWQI